MATVSATDLEVSPHIDPEALASRLDRYGIVAIPGYLAGAKLGAVRDECRRLAADRSPGIIERDYHCGESLLVDRSLWEYYRYPEISAMCDSHFMRDIATRFLGNRCAFNNQFLLTRETEAGVPITGLHFDRLHTLKFFIYLLDTTRANGAFECVPASHKLTARIRAYHLRRGVRLLDLPNFDVPSVLEAPTAIEGKAGTLLVFTTDLFHRGGVIQEGNERWVLRAHSRRLPLPVYHPRKFLSRQWWRESPLNPLRYYYGVMDAVLGSTPPYSDAAQPVRSAH